MVLGLKKLAGVHCYVRDLEASRRFYVERMGFAEVGRSSQELERAGRQRSLIFQAGEVVVTCTAPRGDGRALRYLSRHPDGVGELAFEVESIQRAFAELEKRGGTPTSEPRWFTDDCGSIAMFAITTPLGDTTFRFIERRGYRGAFPGMEAYDIPRGARNELGFGQIDHVTTNYRTMKPALLWMEHVLGLQPFWDVEFHTEGVAQQAHAGSGLRSTVMWDPASGIKLANNEPLRPSFHNSQISLFCEDNRGDGIQHVALSVSGIALTVRALRERGVELMPAPPRYYQNLPERLRALGIEPSDLDVERLSALGILVDGSGADAYLLQIFLKEAAAQEQRKDAGPFFYELIQRQGAVGFGEGNFKALFDSIEGQQLARTA